MSDVSTTPATLSDEQRRELDELGYTVIPGVLTDAECDEWSATVDDIWKQQRTMPRDYLEAPNVQFTNNLIAHSLLFERCFLEPVVVDAATHMLGPDLSVERVNGRRADPLGGNQPLHDLVRRRGRPFVKCNTIWCIDPFTRLNGGTRVLPGSHLGPDEVTVPHNDPRLPHPDERIVEAPRGAVVVFNAALVHGGSPNRSDRPRRSVQGTYGRAGEPTFYDWNELPEEIRHGLSPRTRALMGLA